MPGETFEVVPRITELITGIQQTRKHMKGVYIDATRCSLGIQRLEGYRKKYSRAETRFLDEPDKSNGCTEGADSFRQYAQAKELGMISTKTTNYVEPPPPDWRT